MAKRTAHPVICFKCDAAGCERCGGSGYVRCVVDKWSSAKNVPADPSELTVSQLNYHFMQKGRK